MLKKNRSIENLKRKIKSIHQLMDKSFSSKSKNLTGGLEIEMYLMRGKDAHNRGLCDNENYMNNILLDLPDTITRDYYAYQIEIRTTPHKTAEGMINELKKTMKQTAEVCANYGCSIVPMSWLGGGEMYNGLHFHIRYNRNNQFYHSMINSYPYMLSMAQLMKNSPPSMTDLSYRMVHSSHISLPQLHRSSFNSIGTGNGRYQDIIINKNRDNNRHRNKDTNTLEIRMFDVPTTFEYMEFFIKMMFEIYGHLKNQDAFYFNEGNLDDYKKIANFAREELVNCKNPVNYFFGNSPQSLIMDVLCDIFKVEPPLTEPFPIIKEIKSISELKSKQGYLGIHEIYPFLNPKMKFGEKKLKELTNEEVLDQLGPISPATQELQRSIDRGGSGEDDIDPSPHYNATATYTSIDGTSSNPHMVFTNEMARTSSLAPPSESLIHRINVNVQHSRTLGGDVRVIMTFSRPNFMLISRTNYMESMFNDYILNIDGEETRFSERRLQVIRTITLGFPNTNELENKITHVKEEMEVLECPRAAYRYYIERNQRQSRGEQAVNSGGGGTRRRQRIPPTIVTGL